MTTLPTIGWIGTGVMGAAMAGHVLDAGYPLVVHTRTKAKAEPLLDRGAGWAATPADAADGAQIVCSIVGFPADVESVHLGSQGTLTAARPPRVIVDLTTSSPALAVRLHAAARDRGVGSVDAPVSGGDVGTESGTLSIMVGGDDDDVATVRPLLERFGGRIVHQGGPGAGQHTKMVNQIVIASTMVGACEGLLYARRAGLDPTRVLESIGAGAAGSWTLDNLVPRMIAGDFAPGFFVEHFIKDLGIAVASATTMGLELEGLALARRLYETLAAQGHARSGTQALVLAMEQNVPSPKGP